MILGIDPGLANVGWAVISDENTLVASGCIVTDKKKGKAERLMEIYEKILKVIKENKVKIVSLESLFFAKNISSALPVAETIGVIRLCGIKNGCEVVEYTPLQIKMALVGYGRAEKEQVEAMVRQQLGFGDKVKIDHEADAMAAALTYLFTMKYE